MWPSIATRRHQFSATRSLDTQCSIIRYLGTGGRPSALPRMTGTMSRCNEPAVRDRPATPCTTTLYGRHISRKKLHQTGAMGRIRRWCRTRRDMCMYSRRPSAMRARPSGPAAMEEELRPFTVRKRAEMPRDRRERLGGWYVMPTCFVLRGRLRLDDTYPRPRRRSKSTRARVDVSTQYTALSAPASRQIPIHAARTASTG